MIEFQYIHHKNRPQFADQRFDLSKPGINLILGYNKQTGSNNGVGKSLFFGALAEFLCEDNFAGIKQDKTRRGSFAFGVKRDGVMYDCERTFSPREKITIRKDGEDLGIRELSAAREYILHHVAPYGETEVRSYLYLDLANGVDPLISGSTSTRKQFFRDFFSQIDGLSSIKKIIDAEMFSKSVAARRLEELRADITTLKETIPEDLEETVAELQRLEAEFEDVQTKARDFSRAVTLRDSIASLQVPEHLRTSAEEIDARHSLVSRALTEARGRIDAMDRAKDWDEEFAANRAELKKAKAEFEALGLDLDLDGARKWLSDLEESEAKLSAVISEYKSALSSYESSLRETESRLSSLKRREAALEGEADVCPECGQEHDNKEAKKKLKAVKAEISSLEAPEPPDETEFNRALKKREKVQANMSVAQEANDLLVKISKLVRSSSDRPDAPEENARPSILKKISSLREELSLMETARSRAALVEEWNRLPSHIRKGSKNSDGVVSRALELTGLIAIKKTAVFEANNRKNELRNKILERNKLKEEIQDIDSLKILQDAFSPRKGVEVEMMTTAGSMLSEQTNKFAKFMFAEDFEFSFELGNTFDILVKRRFGGQASEPTDVRLLSGAEKRLFSMVLLMARLSFVPKKDRPNILVLDEPTATMGEDNKRRFAEFLPILATVIPTIIVITPLNPQDYMAISPRVYTVVKDGAHSSIQKGIVDGSSIGDRVQLADVAGRGKRIKHDGPSGDEHPKVRKNRSSSRANA